MKVHKQYYKGWIVGRTYGSTNSSAHTYFHYCLHPDVCLHNKEESPVKRPLWNTTMYEILIWNEPFKDVLTFVDFWGYSARFLSQKMQGYVYMTDHEFANEILKNNLNHKTLAGRFVFAARGSAAKIIRY